MDRMGRCLKVVVVVIALVGLTLSMLAAKDMKMSSKGKEVSVTGRLACTFCTLSHPAMVCPKGCCPKCIKAGDPPLLVDAKGNLYLLTANEMQGKLMTSERMTMTGQKVVVKGLLVKGKGIQAIFVDDMRKAR